MSTIVVQEQVSAHVDNFTTSIIITIRCHHFIYISWYPTLFWIKLLLDIDPNCVIIVTSEDDDDQERDRLVSG